MIEAGSINSLQKKIDTLAELRSKLNNVARTQNQRQQQQQQQQNNNGQPSLEAAEEAADPFLQFLQSF